MPPIFGLTSFLALRYKDVALYFEIGRDVYEAWTVYCFYGFMAAYLEGRDGCPPGGLAASALVQGAAPQRHFPPLCCVPAWDMPSGQFVRRTRAGVLQYCLVQNACAFIVFATQAWAAAARTAAPCRMGHVPRPPRTPPSWHAAVADPLRRRSQHVHKYTAEAPGLGSLDPLVPWPAPPPGAPRASRR